MPRHGVKGQQNEASIADWPSVKATSMVTGNVLGVSPGALTSEIVVTVPSDGVSVMKLVGLQLKRFACKLFTEFTLRIRSLYRSNTICNIFYSINAG